MSSPGQAPPMPQGPGFITVILDIPFSLAIPNGQYTVFDPVKGMAIVQPVMKEGSRTFFRDTPITGPTSFDDLKRKAQEYVRPRQAYSYVVVSRLTDGTQKATLNIHSGAGGGFAETKYYTEVQITYLEDDLGVLSRQDGSVLQRTTDILNRFLDKYRLLTEDYRVGRVSSERNFYFAMCHTSPLTPEERGLNTGQLFATLSKGRTFLHQLGHGGGNILRSHSLEHLGPRSQLADEALRTLAQFLQTDYEMPLSYDLIMEAYRLRHANSRITLDVYTRAISATKREANNRVMEMVFEAGKKALSAPSSAPLRGAQPQKKKGADRSSTLVSTLRGAS
jgi:hypothetical protein